MGPGNSPWRGGRRGPAGPSGTGCGAAPGPRPPHSCRPVRARGPRGRGHGRGPAGCGGAGRPPARPATPRTREDRMSTLLRGPGSGRQSGLGAPLLFATRAGRPVWPAIPEDPAVCTHDPQQQPRGRRGDLGEDRGGFSWYFLEQPMPRALCMLCMVAWVTPRRSRHAHRRRERRRRACERACVRGCICVEGPRRYSSSTLRLS